MPTELAPGTRRHDFYGHATESDFPFRTALAQAIGPIELDIRAHAQTPPPVPVSSALYVGPQRDKEALPRLVITRQDAATRLVFGATLDVQLEHETIWHAYGEDIASAEIYLLGVTAAYWLEMRGWAALHGAAVAVDGRAVALLGGNGSGKSTLAIAMLKRGAALVSDDLLPVSIGATARVAPGPPQLRLWPAQARRILGIDGGMARVHPALEKRVVPLEMIQGAGHAATGAELAAIVLPERDQSAIELSRLRGAAATMALVGAGFLAPLTPHAPWRDDHLTRLIQLAERVPIYRLAYPNGVEQLPALCETLDALLRG